MPDLGGVARAARGPVRVCVCVARLGRRLKFLVGKCRRTAKYLLNVPNPIAGRGFGKFSTIVMLDLPNRRHAVGFGKLSRF